MTVSACLLLASIYACQDFLNPGHSLLRPESQRLDFSAGPVVIVSPGSMGGWSFMNDLVNTACTTTALCALVTGPSGMPSGFGSAELNTTAISDGIGIVRAGYLGTPLDQITELSYSTYRQSADAGNNLAIALQLNVDYDLTDADRSYQGRLVYEPYRAAPFPSGRGANRPRGEAHRTCNPSRACRRVLKRTRGVSRKVSKNVNSRRGRGEQKQPLGTQRQRIVW